jgi:hypothetical protein
MAAEYTDAQLLGLGKLAREQCKPGPEQFYAIAYGGISSLSPDYFAVVERRTQHVWLYLPHEYSGLGLPGVKPADGPIGIVVTSEED